MLVKEVFETNPDFGKAPKERSIYEHLERGIVNLDKPRGPSSHQVSSWVKDILHCKKAGHSGTLDPGVSGVLPVCLNKSTKIIQSLLKSSKKYVTLMKLHSDKKEMEIRRVMGEFEGEIIQKPPVKSAVRRRPRKRTIYKIDILEIDGRYVLFEAEVEAGTYIRKLCHDIGLALGTNAHMQELRRVKAGPFREKDCITLHQLSEAWTSFEQTKDESLLRKAVVPLEDGVKDLPKVYIKDTAVSSVCHGAALSANGISKMEEFGKDVLTAVFTLKEELVGTGKSILSAKEIMEKEKEPSIRLSQITLPRKAYPKMWK
jgi:H/ACA ribonucleoprotein complex subunit 4